MHAVYANCVTNEVKPYAGEEDCIRVANTAIKILNSWNMRKKAKGKERLFPSLL